MVFKGFRRVFKGPRFGTAQHAAVAEAPEAAPCTAGEGAGRGAAPETAT